MGNTNLPQGGAAHEHNSRDTLSGAGQPTERQKKLARGKLPPEFVQPDPAVTPSQDILGYVDTGHSPPDAT